MSAREFSIPGADSHIVHSTDAVPALLINPDARDCDLGASAAALTMNVQHALESLAAHCDYEHSALAHAFAAQLDMAGDLLAVLIRRLEPKGAE